MAEEVKLTLSAHHDGGKPGDTLTTDPVTAKRLVGAGVAVPSTAAAAKAIDADPDTAKTRR